MVALLAEGVDRNVNVGADELVVCGSPSSRRAWIEIWPLRKSSRRPCVALLAEGVDRNSKDRLAPMIRDTVALLAEGVDRNALWADTPVCDAGRPPRGGRG